MPYPDLELFQGTKKQLKECFYKGTEEVWKSLGDHHFDPLIKPIVVLEAKG